MQFVKNHWISLLSGLVALMGIAGAVWFMMSDSVVEEMSKHKQLGANISRLMSSPKNQAMIDAERDRGKAFSDEYNKTLSVAEDRNRREVLLDGVFPKPADLQRHYQFKEEYVTAVYQLPRELGGGGLPTAQDVQDMTEIMEDEARRKAEQEDDSVPTQKWTQPTGNTFRPGRGTTFQPSPRMGGPQMPPRGGNLRPGAGGPPGNYNPYGGATGGGNMFRPGGGSGLQAPRGGAFQPSGWGGDDKKNVTVSGAEVQYRAAVTKARSVRTYATPASFHISSMVDSDRPPSERDMWYAQVGLWVQEDMVEAIRDVNDAAAKLLGEDEAHVGNMPVKNVERIHVLGYVMSSGSLLPFLASTGRAQANVDTTHAEFRPSFTNRTSDELFDVIRVQLVVVVDCRDVLKLIDRVTRGKFLYQLVGVEYTRSEASDERGYFYGGEPSIRAVLDFEGYMARKVYKPLMPAMVLEDLGIAKEEQQ